MPQRYKQNVFYTHGAIRYLSTASKMSRQVRKELLP